MFHVEHMGFVAGRHPVCFGVPLCFGNISGVLVGYRFSGGIGLRWKGSDDLYWGWEGMNGGDCGNKYAVRGFSLMFHVEHLRFSQVDHKHGYVCRGNATDP